MRYLITAGGRNINIIEADSQEIADGIAVISGGTARHVSDGEIIDLYRDHAPIISQETKISRHQAKIVLLRHGLLESAESFIDGASPEMKLAWAEAPEFSRDSPFLSSVANALGINSNQVDSLFLEAFSVKI
jgi:hypothetical protein